MPSNRAPSRSPASRYRRCRSLWRTGPSSHSIPSHSRSRRIASSPPGTLRAGSVSSIRSRSQSAIRRAAAALSALPRWSEPVGLGAKRARTIAPARLREVLVRLEFARRLDRRGEVEALVLGLLDQHHELERVRVVEALLAAARRDARAERPVVELHLRDASDPADLAEGQLELVEVLRQVEGAEAEIEFHGSSIGRRAIRLESENRPASAEPPD